MKSESLSTLAGWLAGERQRIERQVTVREKRGASPETVVTIDHRMPCELEGRAGWHIRTHPTMLPRAHLSSYARAQIKTAEQRRGRAIYCHDEGLGELVAAISYHIDARPRRAVLITMLALRRDAGADAGLRERTLAGALVLKHHVHAISAHTRRGGFVDLDLATDDDQLALAKTLGFRKAPRVRGFRAGGIHLRQPKPGQESGRG